MVFADNQMKGGNPMSHYKHLSIEEREKLYLMHGQGKSFREIARELHRSASTVTREYKRGRGKKHSYMPSRAQHRYEKRRKNCGRKRILSDSVYKEQIRRCVEDLHWSPEQISNRLKLEGNPLQISWISIYRAIWAGLLDTSQARSSHRRKADRFVSKLRRKGKRRKKAGEDHKQGKYTILSTVEDRPEGCQTRAECGHYEGDTVAGKKGGALIVTLVDRRSRICMLKKVASSDSGLTADAIKDMLRRMPRSLTKSVTPDRGHEFAAYRDVMDAIPGVTFYFPPSYAPWQLGTNENTNGPLREFIPKGSDIAALSDEQIQLFEDALNLRPRKCLGWRSPFEVHFQKVLHLT